MSLYQTTVRRSIAAKLCSARCIHYEVHDIVFVAGKMTASAVTVMNGTDYWLSLAGDDEDWNVTPFDNYWYKALIIALYSIVCIGCIVGEYIPLIILLSDIRIQLCN